MKKLFIIALIGSLLGIIGARFLFVGSSMSLIPWGISGLLIGYTTKNNKDALISGGLYGFCLAFIFMVAGYEGSISVIARFPFFALLGIVGGVCGMVLCVIGNVSGRLIKRK